MVFGEVVGAIGFARGPKHMELVLSDAVANPMVSHIHNFEALLFD